MELAVASSSVTLTQVNRSLCFETEPVPWGWSPTVAVPRWYLLGVRQVEVDVGYQLAAGVTAGEARVPVVFVNAWGTSQDQWDRVVAGVGAHTVVTFDRPGVGRSPALPADLRRRSRTFGELADEVRRVLAAVAITSPCVVVGHSIGALIAMAYAARHPEHTAGLVLVDGTTLHHLETTSWPVFDGGDNQPGSSMIDIGGSITELGTAAWPMVPAAVLSSAVGRWTRLTPEEAATYAPLTVAQLDRQWQDGQRVLAEKVGAVLVVADSAGHDVPAEQPELVAACVRAVTTAAQQGSTVVSIPAVELPTAGGSVPPPPPAVPH